MIRKVVFAVRLRIASIRKLVRKKCELRAVNYEVFVEFRPKFLKNFTINSSKFTRLRLVAIKPLRINLRIAADSLVPPGR